MARPSLWRSLLPLEEHALRARCVEDGQRGTAFRLHLEPLAAIGESRVPGDVEVLTSVAVRPDLFVHAPGLSFKVNIGNPAPET